ncbi:dTDP-4-dehydrorhamnose 3,5-epimerase family protein [Rhodocista pekingensis]|uniref:dTDP-4-dehydrorhamnose 3,5-epimerase n=1 Tax=Rhodocista pekingensis TaxID=201185 RepID=A0ABW2KV85_9PROT
MRFEPTAIADARIVRLTAHRDDRGAFARTWCRQTFVDAGIAFDFVQANWSVTRSRGTIRGMHFQRAPHAESKLVRITRGRVHDVIVDLRADSPTRGRLHVMELGEGDDTMLYVPAGVAHGFQTLTDDVTVEYFMGGEPYRPEYYDGFRPDDPAVAIRWPLPPVSVSDKDLSWPPLGQRFPWLLPTPALATPAL